LQQWAYPRDVGDFRLMSRASLYALVNMKEQHRFLRGMSAWVGFPQATVMFCRQERKFGKTKYSLKKMLGLSFDAAFSFSTIPLRLALFMGIGVAGFGFSYMVYSIARKFIFGDTVPGWTTLVILVAITGGTILFCLGIIGEYIGRIYEQVKGRPLYVVYQTRNIQEREN
jgi:polyisoprenyl-phosphate glycosyltransferase